VETPHLAAPPHHLRDDEVRWDKTAPHACDLQQSSERRKIWAFELSEQIDGRVKILKCFVALAQWSDLIGCEEEGTNGIGLA
jgi:hypothetical protein